MALRRGLRHIEALVAQLILPLNRDGRTGNNVKLVEFLQLQDSFEWNGSVFDMRLISVCQRLLVCLDRLISKGTNEQTTLLLLSTLDLMQGLLLLHPPSRHLFARELHMTVCRAIRKLMAGFNRFVGARYRRAGPSGNAPDHCLCTRR